MRVTEVQGDTFTGLYAADGSTNVVVSSGEGFVGAYHPCGAINVTVVDGESFVGSTAADGSVNVVIVEDDIEGDIHPSGALRVVGLEIDEEEGE